MAILIYVNTLDLIRIYIQLQAWLEACQTYESLGSLLSIQNPPPPQGIEKINIGMNSNSLVEKSQNGKQDTECSQLLTST